MKRSFYFLFFVLISCSPKLTETGQPYERVKIAPGPEDMVLDTTNTRQRLLVSCAERRKGSPPFDGIMGYDLESGETYEIPRKNHPDSIRFHPHGIDLGYYNGQKILLVINHEEKEKRHSVIRYNVYDDYLEYDTIFWHKKIMRSPNDVLAGDHGEFWFTNDASSRNNTLELILKIKGGSIGYYDGKGNWKFAAKGFAYPNGLIRMHYSSVWVSTTRQNKIFFMLKDSTGTWQKKYKRTWAKAPGWDNITAPNEHSLICTAHTKPMKFLKHYKDSANKSPVAVYEVSTEYPMKRLLYYSEGDEISAGSTAILYKDYLYISQVFDPFILKVKMK